MIPRPQAPDAEPKAERITQESGSGPDTVRGPDG